MILKMSVWFTRFFYRFFYSIHLWLSRQRHRSILTRFVRSEMHYFSPPFGYRPAAMEILSGSSDFLTKLLAPPGSDVTHCHGCVGYARLAIGGTSRSRGFPYGRLLQKKKKKKAKKKKSTFKKIIIIINKIGSTLSTWAYFSELFAGVEIRSCVVGVDGVDGFPPSWGVLWVGLNDLYEFLSSWDAPWVGLSGPNGFLPAWDAPWVGLNDLYGFLPAWDVLSWTWWPL